MIKNYQIENKRKVKKYHKSRRMFCIYQGKLHIAKANLNYSHAVWFKKENWFPIKKDFLINKIIRGIIDNEGNISFYIGNNFEINKKTEIIFFSHLKQLVKEMKLKANAEIFGGAIKQKPGTKWPPRKKYGKIKDNL